MKIIHVLSGGCDSVTLLYYLISQKHQIECISFDYNQRHKRELKMAYETCKKLKLPFQTINIKSITHLIDNSALTGKIKVPEGHYEDKTMRQTVVPGRNTIMLAIAMAYAANLKFDAVSIGVHKGDRSVYPDCRKEYINAMKEVGKLFDYKKIKILAPFQDLHKGQIVKIGKKLNVDYSLTQTCYNGKEKACGLCGSCQERIFAFNYAKLKDPLIYDNNQIKKEKST